MICRCVHNFLPRSLRLLSPKVRIKRKNLAPAKTICRSGPVFLAAVSCNRSRNTPKARSHFHAGNCGANVHPSPITGRNIPPNMDALRPGAGRKNTFRPNARRPSRRCAPSPYYIDTRRPRSTRGRACHPRSLSLEQLRIRILAAPSPSNASRNLHAALDDSKAANRRSQTWSLAARRDRNRIPVETRSKR
jgi:hypothetical protein